MPSGKTFVETPLSIATPFVEITLSRMRRWKGGKSRIVLDPGCGRGTFLKLLQQSLMGFSLWGVEKDPRLAREAMAATSRTGARVFTGDFFIGPWRETDGSLLEPHPSFFHAVVGNPPYLGFKAQGATLRRRLAEAYGAGFGKSDLSCFAVARSLDLLEPGGLLALILPRYWIDGDSGAKVRDLLEERCDRIEIRTWRDGRVFPGTGVHALCLWARKVKAGRRRGRLDYVLFPEGRLTGKPLGRRDLAWPSPGGLWPLLLKEEEAFLESLRGAGSPFGDWAEAAQGIITGADRTRCGSHGIFVLTGEEVRGLRLSRSERRYLHPWIKSRHIEPLRLRSSNLHLLHLPTDVPWARLPRIRKHLEGHRQRLESRREVGLGRIPWWCLQWGRSPKLHSRRRVLLPAKAQVLRAAPAGEGIRFSADIYSWGLRGSSPGARSGVDPEVVAFWLSLFLSGRVGRHASRLLGKKMGPTAEFYPQTQRNVPIPDPGPRGWEVLEESLQESEAASSIAERRALADAITGRILGFLGIDVDETVPLDGGALQAEL